MERDMVPARSPARQRPPRRQRIHIIPPPHDFTAFDKCDGDEAVAVGAAGVEHFAVHLVFERHDAAVARGVHHQGVAVRELDALAIAGVERHQRRASNDLRRPAAHAVAKLEAHVVGQRIEIMRAIDIGREALHDDAEERIEGAEGGVGGCWHGGPGWREERDSRVRGNDGVGSWRRAQSTASFPGTRESIW